MIVSVSVSKENLQIIDDYCKSVGLKRSTFLTRSAIKEIKSTMNLDTDFFNNLKRESNEL